MPEDNIINQDYMEPEVVAEPVTEAPVTSEIPTQQPAQAQVNQVLGANFGANVQNAIINQAANAIGAVVVYGTAVVVTGILTALGAGIKKVWDSGAEERKAKKEAKKAKKAEKKAKKSQITVVDNGEEIVVVDD